MARHQFVGSATSYEEFEMTYTNPEDQYTKSVLFPKLSALIFGPFYFLIHGAWRLILGYILWVYFIPIWCASKVYETDLMGALETDGVILIFLAHIIYALFARRMMHGHYIRKGWVPSHTAADDAANIATTAAAAGIAKKLLTK